MTVPGLDYAALKRVLTQSPRFTELVADLPLFVLVDAGPIPVEEWSLEEYKQVFNWINGDLSLAVPDVIQNYVNAIKEKDVKGNQGCTHPGTGGFHSFQGENYDGPCVYCGDLPAPP